MNNYPAFPVTGGSGNKDTTGMTLRDYFAAHATDDDLRPYADLIRAEVQRKHGVGVLPDDWRVVARYMHADAMLKAREA